MITLVYLLTGTAAAGASDTSDGLSQEEKEGIAVYV